MTSWRRSSRSQNGADNCVEVARTGGVVRVRDSKNRTGPELAFESGVFEQFLHGAGRSG